jgi:hypothetical protein
VLRSFALSAASAGKVQFDGYLALFCELHGVAEQIHHDSFPGGALGFESPVDRRIDVDQSNNIARFGQFPRDLVRLALTEVSHESGVIRGVSVASVLTCHVTEENALDDIVHKCAQVGDWRSVCLDLAIFGELKNMLCSSLGRICNPASVSVGSHPL